MTDPEIWKPVVGYEGLYEVSSHGHVRSLDRSLPCVNRFGNPEVRRYRGRLLRPGPMKSGHLSVAIGKGNSRLVHQLVLEAFVGPCPRGYECLHKDGNAANNKLSNLHWGTRSQNLIDIFYHTGRRLSREQVLYLRKRKEEGFYYGELYNLALSWGINPGTVWSATHGKHYAHVT